MAKSPPGPKEMAPGVEFGTYYPITFEEEAPPQPTDEDVDLED